MAENLVKDLGTSTPSALLAGVGIPAPIDGAGVAPGQGVLSAGQLMKQDPTTKLYSKATGDDIAVSVKMGILATDKDTGTETTGDGFVCPVYLGGEFIRSRVIPGDLTEPQEATLQAMGFYLSDELTFGTAPTVIDNTAE